MKEKIIIACSKKWFFKNQKVKKYIKKKNILILQKKDYLNEKYLKKVNPKIIFFPHWSYKVKENIIKKYRCICFHTAPLPYGRGGSPIQNLIIRNFKKSPICAIKMTNKIDAGPIYMKKTISLSGNLNKIFERMAEKIIQMIIILSKKNIKPKKQRGKIYNFKRLSEQPEIIKERKIEEIFDKIRMLDSDDYNNAYIKNNNLKIYLSNPKKKKNYIICDAKIFKLK